MRYSIPVRFALVLALSACAARNDDADAARLEAGADARDERAPVAPDATPAADATAALDASPDDALEPDAEPRLDAAVPLDAAPRDAPSATDAPRVDAPRADAAPAACTGRPGTPGDHVVMLVSGGLMRRYMVHVPASYRADRATQVVLNFAGYNNSGASQDRMSGLSTAADARGFIAVHPDGTGSPYSWNAGRCCGSAPGARVDDVQFVRDMLAQLEREYCVDRRRVFAMGWSNGAMLTHRLACELADRIAAIGPVSGTLGISTCVPSRPVAVLSTHGTADDRVPWDGGPPANTEPVPVTVAGWAMRDGCTDAARPTEVFRRGATHCDTRRMCAGGTEVKLCTVDGAGHNWLSTADHNTTAEILDFFAAHPMP